MESGENIDRKLSEDSAQSGEVCEVTLNNRSESLDEQTGDVSGEMEVRHHNLQTILEDINKRYAHTLRSLAAWDQGIDLPRKVENTEDEE